MKEISLLQVNNIIEKGGATISSNNAKVLNLKWGFMVSIYGTETKVNLNEKFAREWLQIIINNYINTSKGGFVGVWVHNNYAYVDVSVRFISKSKALSFGRQNGQIAIYQNRKGLEIMC